MVFKSWRTLGTPTLAHELSALNATATAASNKIGRGGGGGGWGLLCWRASPPCLEGLVGGPYSDGPLNAVRKSILSRVGVGEENCIYIDGNESERS